MVKTENLHSIINDLNGFDTACIVGADIVAAKLFASRFKYVVVIDTFNHKDSLSIFHANTKEFPNILVIKSPLDYITKSFRNDQFDAVYISDATSDNALRYQLTLVSNITKNRIIVPDLDVVRSIMENFDAVIKLDYWHVIA